jgi:hypothetical protein
MSTIAQGVELFNIFAETWGKDKAQVAIKDIESMIDAKNQELATKGDLREVELKLTKEIKEVELKLTKEIEQSKSSTIKWVVGWMAGFIMAQTAAIIAILKFLK